VFQDQVPGKPPRILTLSPGNMQPEVTVAPDDPSTPVYEGNEVRVALSENVDPCSVEFGTTVFVKEYERGHPVDGFIPVTDSDPGNDFTWGASNSTTVDATPGTPQFDPLTVRCVVTLEQTATRTEVVIRPEFTEWPDNALIVVELTFAIVDFAGEALTQPTPADPPLRFSFTTQNRPQQQRAIEMTFDREETKINEDGQVIVTVPASPPVLLDSTSADFDSTRATSKAQGFLLPMGDGDNGTNLLLPTKRALRAACTTDRPAHDSVKDDFVATAGVTILDTGSVLNTCPNSTDGSNAVVWEFRTFTIRSNAVVKLIGVNPAIFLVQGDATIETNGMLLVRGDGVAPSPRSAGNNGAFYPGTAVAIGGTGVAAGARGGNGVNGNNTTTYSQDGFATVGSPTVSATNPVQIQGGVGAGQGNVRTTISAQTFVSQASGTGGGGGGHGSVGGAGGSLGGGTVHAFVSTVRGAGGAVTGTDRLVTPSAGNGGGGAPNQYNTFAPTFSTAGGSGGAGGGFVDITSGGRLRIAGTIDAAGGAGGNGASGFIGAAGGGGGGGGGGIRLLSPTAIDLTGSTVTAMGGNRGNPGGCTMYAVAPLNFGGSGGTGRLAVEDGDGVIQGQGGANLTPREGQPGFYRGLFDPTRFLGGGTESEVLTDLMFAGPAAPSYVNPTAADFPVIAHNPPVPGDGPGAGIPTDSSRGLGFTGIMIEARGFPQDEDGLPVVPANLDLPTSPKFFTVGYFTDNTDPNNPTWVPAAFPPDVGPRSKFKNNVGDGISNASPLSPNGKPFIQLRITFFMRSGVSLNSPGPFLNHMRLPFNYNQ
jgi:hypothetical protein